MTWSRRERLIDRCLVTGVIIGDLAGQALASDGREVASAPAGAGAVALTLLGAAPLLIRRQRPFLAMAALGVAAIATAALVPPGLLSQQLGLTAVLAVYAVAAWSAHRRWAVVVPAALAVLVFTGALADDTAAVESALATIAIIGLPWAVGYAARSRRLYVEQVEQRLADAERDRDEQARRAVAEERAHIARELHDVVAHHVSLIGVQAGAARTMLPPGADATRAALSAIEDSSRAAVREMRQLLEVLRDDGALLDVSPPPGFDTLGPLIDGFRSAGIDVDATVDAGHPTLDPVLAVCCYRVVEEALTNVTRHSAARRATVVVAADAERVRIAVRDPGPALLPPPGPRHQGRGLLGMGERVGMFGGRLDTGRAPDGGFAVLAELPRGTTS